MRSQPTPARLAPSASGVLVLDGYGVRLRVERGRLEASDGTGRRRRAGSFPRAGSALRRVVVIGHTGFVSLEAARWLADTGTGLVQLDTDGRLLAASAGLGRDDARLRRAQARAIDAPAGDAVARTLIAEKVAAQSDTLRAVDAVAPVADGAVAAMRDAAARIHASTSRDEVRLAEALAAAAYWGAWSAVPVRFARRDASRVPESWLRFGARTSPLTSSPRSAVNPANAVLNYLYAVLEAEARLACLAVGLDPGLGVLHSDVPSRDSLALDVLEPVRPLVDRYVLAMLARRSFRAADFAETRQGACRLLEPLTHELAGTALDWRGHLGHVAEQVVRLVAAGTPVKVPTPVTGANLSRAHGNAPRHLRRALPRPAQRCLYCGGEPAPGRQSCEQCAPEVASDATARVVEAGRAGLRAARAAGRRPGLGEDANRRRGKRVAEQLAGVPQSRPGPDDIERFRRDVLPGLAGVSARQLAARAGISVSYAAAILRGERVPHLRHWVALTLVRAPQG